MLNSLSVDKSWGTTAVGDVVIFKLSAIHYMIDATVGVNEGNMRGVRFALDTGAGFNIIRRNVLPNGWEGVQMSRNEHRLLMTLTETLQTLDKLYG